VAQCLRRAFALFASTCAFVFGSPGAAQSTDAFAEPVYRPWIRMTYGAPWTRRDVTYQRWVAKGSRLPHFVAWANASFPVPAPGATLNIYVGRCPNPADRASFGPGNVIRICNGFVFDSVDQYMKAERLSVLEAGHATEGMMYFTFFHEFAHAVEANYGLPVLGNAEASADEFAALAIAGHPAMYGDAVSALNYFWDARNATASRAASPYDWDEHPMNTERISQTSCLLYESDPRYFRVFAVRFGLTGRNESSCAGRYRLALRSWRRVLEAARVRLSAAETRLFD
jgi:Putative metallopeptidase